MTDGRWRTRKVDTSTSALPSTQASLLRLGEGVASPPPPPPARVAMAASMPCNGSWPTCSIVVVIKVGRERIICQGGADSTLSFRPNTGCQDATPLRHFSPPARVAALSLFYLDHAPINQPSTKSASVPRPAPPEALSGTPRRGAKARALFCECPPPRVGAWGRGEGLAGSGLVCRGPFLSWLPVAARCCPLLLPVGFPGWMHKPGDRARATRALKGKGAGRKRGVNTRPASTAPRPRLEPGQSSVL